jgi:hypothetical protein
LIEMTNHTRPTLALALLAGLLGFGTLSAARAVDLTGAWSVTITSADGPITGKATLKQAGDKVTGLIGPVGDPTIPVEGALAGDALTLTTHPQQGRTAAFDHCDLTVTDAKLSGTIHGGDLGKGAIEFVRAQPAH